MTFQSTVVKIAGVTLIVIFIMLIASFYYMNKNQKYPPVIGGCPDYWELNQINGKPVCINKSDFITFEVFSPEKVPVT